MYTPHREEPKQITIQHKFSKAEFISRHERGVSADFDLEKWSIDRFNDSKISFPVWPVMVLSSNKNEITWLFLIKLRKIEIQLPNEGETCRFSPTTTYETARPLQIWWMARRIAMPYSRLGPGTDWDKFGAFKVTVPRTTVIKPAWELEPNSERTGNLSISQRNSKRVVLNLRVSDTTVNFELSALKTMKEASSAERLGKILTYWAAFDRPGFFLNIFHHLPHLTNFQNVSQPLKDKLMQKYQSLDSHQKIAYDNLLRNIPCGICIVPGGPGAGKTTWNLFVAAAAQSSDSVVLGRGPEMTTRRMKVLYLLDINKPLGDIASRMIKLYNELGMRKNVLRMYYWRYELMETFTGTINAQRCEVESAIANIEAADANQVIPSNKEDNPVIKEASPSDKEKKQDVKEVSPSNKEIKQKIKGPSRSFRFLDFSSAFLEIGNNKKRPPKERIKDRGDCLAMTLDEAAWEYYEANKDDKYQHLHYMMPKALKEGKTNEYFKSLVQKIYQEVLKATDFIATTPVAASKYLKDRWGPDLVFFDEAPHAREASNLTAVANFEPLAFFFTGDPKQTQPFVRYPARISDPKKPPPTNYWRSQLKVSMMERAEKLGAISHSLLINHRARANLHKLASSLFYDNKMETAMSGDSLHPPSTKHLMEWMSSMLSAPCKIPRIRISMEGKEDDLEEVGTSFRNTRHL